ncbi:MULTISPECIES: hypothetical protein [Variovorax]|uniref:NHL domain-containing protein n=1 Tax=Variovorax TaxID=34072 RepID=UPI002855C393|nr:hypothetical protein [Variovorax sp. 3319]MDR6890977.1 hypothetical protein [Variovorax sp. 3319]
MKYFDLRRTASTSLALAATLLAAACGGGGGSGGGGGLPLTPIVVAPTAPTSPNTAEPGNTGNPGTPPDSGTPDSESYTVSLLAGSNTQTEGFEDGTGEAAKFSCPTAIANGPNFSLVVADGAGTGKHRIRTIEQGTVATQLLYNANGSVISGIMVDPIGRYIVSSPDNTYVSAFSPDGKTEERWGVGKLMGPSGAVLGANGDYIVADAGDLKIKTLNPTNDSVTTFVGSIKGDADGSGSNAQFKYPKAIAIDATGNTYVADPEGHTIRKISTLGEVSTLAGSGTAGHADGQGKYALLSAPVAVAVGPKGDIFFAERGSHTIRKISASGFVSTIAGVAFDSGATNGLGNKAKFRDPEGLAVTSNGTIYVADCGNHQIRKLRPSS